MPRRISLAILVFALCAGVWAQVPPRPNVPDATFGTVVGPTTQGTINYLLGGASDIVLDEQRQRLYLVNPGQRRVEIYSTTQRRFVNVINVDAIPLSAALSVSGKYLYVTCFEASAINMIDLDTVSVVRRIPLPARPEGIAVGFNERLLITTIGTGPNNNANTLLLYDPNAPENVNPLSTVVFTPPPPASPVLPPPAGRVAFSQRTNLMASPDRSLILGFNSLTNQTQRAAFVFDVASGGILRSRIVNDSSTVLSIAPDGSRFMAGLTLFDTSTLQVMARQNAANLPYTLPSGSNFNLQQNQGGSVFTPDGSYLISAFNFSILENPPARANISQLLFNDPENMLTQFGLKLPENLSGNMVISSDGATIYALSESGFLIIPLSQIFNSPIALPSRTGVLVGNDQCGATAGIRTSRVEVTNGGKGRFTSTLQLVPNINGVIPPIAGTPGLGGAGAPGGGAASTGLVIALPPAPSGSTAGTGVILPGQPGGGNALTQQQNALLQTTPNVRMVNTSDGATIDFSYNAVNARALGTTVPHDFEVVAPNAINIPPQIRVFQNNRDTEARADIKVVPTAVAGNEGLTDMVYDERRRRLYIANSGLNRVEVYDLQNGEFLDPVKVGQLPRSLALTPSGDFLYVGNSGGESISIIDPELLQVTGKVRFPALPFNSGAAIVSPAIVAATERGVLVLMNNGTLWSLIGDEAVPRPTSPLIGTNVIPAPRTMAATPNGEFLLLLAGNGYVYLYDALVNDFVQSRQVFTNPIQGYYGPIAAGPRGQYFAVNGYVLNQALTIIGSAGSVTVPGQRPGAGSTATKPVAAVAAVNASFYARFSPPVLANAAALATALPTVEIVDAATGAVRGQAQVALESILSTAVGNARVNVNGRTMAVDTTANTAYILTTSGLSVVPLETLPTTDRPQVNNGGVVNLASYLNQFSPGNLITIFGSNLGDTEVAGDKWPTVLGGVCVTLNGNPIPLAMVTPGQINAQLPFSLTASRNGTAYALFVRSLDRKLTSAQATIRLVPYAPAILVETSTGQAAVYHQDGRPVSADHPATRDQRLFIYALGLGAVKGPKLVAGEATPASPVGATAEVQVFIDDPTIKESEVSVEESILVPGMFGVYRVQVYLPWSRRRGPKLPVTLRVGGVDSQKTGPAVPYIPVE